MLVLASSLDSHLVEFPASLCQCRVEKRVKVSANLSKFEVLGTFRLTVTKIVFPWYLPQVLSPQAQASSAVQNYVPGTVAER